MSKVGGGILILVWLAILVTGIVLRLSIGYTDGDGAVRGSGGVGGGGGVTWEGG